MWVENPALKPPWEQQQLVKGIRRQLCGGQVGLHDDATDFQIFKLKGMIHCAPCLEKGLTAQPLFSLMQILSLVPECQCPGGQHKLQGGAVEVYKSSAFSDTFHSPKACAP